MYYSEVEDHLEHYGVKGMKWGVRKAETFPRVYLVDKTIKHADEPAFAEMEIIAVWKNNRIVSIKIPDMSEANHSANLGDFLAHFGVEDDRFNGPVARGMAFVRRYR